MLLRAILPGDDQGADINKMGHHRASQAAMAGSKMQI
jgi:hypothetical protein